MIVKSVTQVEIGLEILCNSFHVLFFEGAVHLPIRPGEGVPRFQLQTSSIDRVAADDKHADALAMSDVGLDRNRKDRIVVY